MSMAAECARVFCVFFFLFSVDAEENPCVNLNEAFHRDEFWNILLQQVCFLFLLYLLFSSYAMKKVPKQACRPQIAHSLSKVSSVWADVAQNTERSPDYFDWYSQLSLKHSLSTQHLESAGVIVFGK